MSSSAIGWVGVETQLGVIITGSRFTRPRIVSNAALSLPITMAARSVVTGTPSAASRSTGLRRASGAPAGGEPLAGLAAAAQVRGRVAVVASQAAEIDDLLHAVGGRGARD